MGKYYSIFLVRVSLHVSRDCRHGLPFRIARLYDVCGMTYADSLNLRFERRGKFDLSGAGLLTTPQEKCLPFHMS